MAALHLIGDVLDDFGQPSEVRENGRELQCGSEEGRDQRREHPRGAGGACLGSSQSTGTATTLSPSACSNRPSTNRGRLQIWFGVHSAPPRCDTFSLFPRVATAFIKGQGLPKACAASAMTSAGIVQPGSAGEAPQFGCQSPEKNNRACVRWPARIFSGSACAPFATTVKSSNRRCRR